MKKLSNKFFILMMWIVLVIIGVLQFFELPKALDYILLVLAVILGIIGIYKKFKIAY